ncbi:MAG: transposase [Opitutales bacterium]|nr:transposase [Opitutales bacterium]
MNMESAEQPVVDENVLVNRTGSGTAAAGVSQHVPRKARRVPRAVVPAGRDGYYHVVSRINGRAFLLTDTRRETFRDLMGRVAGFCGVEILTYCLMGNHFHLLARVPGEVGEIDDAELLRRAGLLYGKPSAGSRQPLTLKGIRSVLEGDDETDRVAMRKLLIGRMGSLPMFVKILKQRFALQYNRESGRLGTLWEGPFRSVLVEPTRAALSVVGAYIDLNPVRAGVVADPADYRFSGYGEALGTGKPTGHALLRRMVLLGRAGNSVAGAAGSGRGRERRASAAVSGEAAEGAGFGGASAAEARRSGETAGEAGGSGDGAERLSKAELKAALAEYRRLLYWKGAGRRRATDGVIDRGRVEKVLKAGGRLSLPELLRCRVRYLTDGAVIGRKWWIETWLRGRSATRKTAPKRMRFADWGGLCSLRDLRKDVVG